MLCTSIQTEACIPVRLGLIMLALVEFFNHISGIQCLYEYTQDNIVLLIELSEILSCCSLHYFSQRT